MKNCIFLIALTFLSCSVVKKSELKTRSGNPIFEGWYADPEAHIFGKTCWVFPTFSAKYEQQVHFDAFSSTDLVTWTKHARILDTAAVKWAKRAMWAPSIVEKQGKYYFFFGANDIQNDAEKGGIGVAVADSPDGKFRDYLGKPLVDKFHNGAQPIDQFVFKDLSKDRHGSRAPLGHQLTGHGRVVHRLPPPPTVGNGRKLPPGLHRKYVF